MSALPPSPPFGPAHFLNRELSWLEFNQRVLDEALDRANPLLERLKFFTIVSSNLDEFFEVRVAGVKQQIESGVTERSFDGLTPPETFQHIVRRVRRMVAEQYHCWREDLAPKLAAAGIRILKASELSPEDMLWLTDYYRAKVHPVLTPILLDPAHPFPLLVNKSLNLIARLELPGKGGGEKLGLVQLPHVLPRLIQLPRENGGRDYVYLGHLIGHFIHDLFPKARPLGWWPIRVTRNSELYIDEEETSNLLRAVESELQNRRKGAAVRLEVDHGCPPDITDRLLRTLALTAQDLYLVDGPLNPVRLMMLYAGDHSPELRDPPFVAPTVPSLRDQPDLFAAIRERDHLLHHPYDHFDSVVAFLEQAAADPDVLAIKQTLYRTGGDKRIIGALLQAARNGKQVTAVVELRARFDEANNIQWARTLEEAGVHVVYGLVGYKIHAKVCLVVRREGHVLRRYVHLATGNYNPSTAKLYTDLGLLTCRPEFGEDATRLFNLLTGICQFPGMQRLMLAPFEMLDRVLGLIAREREHARQGLPARIIAKMNSLVTQEVIEALYQASQAGVKIDLIVRGICCLRPGLPGISENITVRSIVDRFLEHSRIFYFENACQPQVYVGSADWMPRNLFKRIEVNFPLIDGNLCERVVAEVLGTTLADQARARFLQADGTYRKLPLPEGQAPRRSQFEFIARAEANRPTGPREPAAKGRQLRVRLAPRPMAFFDVRPSRRP
jgi:polyphosphate kinase